MEFLFPLLLAGMLVFMYMGIRRQKKEAEKVADMQSSLKVGDSVVTTSGLYGTVVDVDDATVDLEIAEDVVTTWLRQAIRELRTDDVSSTGETVADEAVTDDAEPVVVEESPAQTETRLTKD
ncbi:preprotein translocase subunit YajC [Nocardia goodfellowii]|uniref:Preprotein translocase subunit YajC n=1 Tax=Nocardia goodfellowii TaxID=882446 RepID=A0ABS4QG19_9NOCA|nr:preprotein translocase subunit YajC [Nocardia goodfellowii]MBP2190615.1 preprotein translocase subunit YajC [Nocardia goodfellowii]